MKVERALLREIRLRLREPFRTSRGVVEERRIMLVTLEGEGLEGWGECVAGVDASSTETVDSAWEALEGLILPRVVGRELARPEEAFVASEGLSGHPMAAAAAEMAARDLAARAEGASLSRALGGVRRTIPVGVSVGLQPSDRQLGDVVARYLADGYARVKVKIEPGRDVEMVANLRARFPKVSLWADANAAYTLHDIPRLRELDALGLELLEQPLASDDLAGHARLQEALATPICLDESIASEGDVRRALDLGACRVINLKPGRVGGYAVSLRMHDVVRASGLDLWCGGMLESGVGRAHNVALASLPGFTLPGDISASRRYWERDIVTPELVIDNGRIAVPGGPGIGVDVDIERVRALTVREAVV
jgi:O-succinylbenzoate synthase